MKILLINGSPKGKNSNSLKLARAFLEGLAEECETQTEELTLSQLNIDPCKGCFCCWNKTPGKCVISDDMRMIIDRELWADLIVWSFPLYYFGVPGPLKTMIDRQLPMSMPFMNDKEGNIGSVSHPSRYDMSGKRHVLISTCGFYSADKNYDSVKSMFDHICGFHRYDTIFCGQGELFHVSELRSRTDEYLDLVRKAGVEYVGGGISMETQQRLEELLFPKEVFEEMADASWGIDKETGEKEDKSLAFTRQMAALYRKDSFDGKERILEICYTDLGKTYQILLNQNGSKVFTDGSLKATTRIDTPWEVWTSIARGDIRGDAALAQGQYRVSGDFDLMIHWDSYFGGGTSQKKRDSDEASFQTKPNKQPVMFTMLAAWITFWVAVSINSRIGAVVTMAVCACLPLLMVKRILTVYDKISFAVVSVLAAFTLFSGMRTIALVFGYFAFGLMWLLSCLTREPVCTAYVKYGYGGEDALSNPIFMKTNYILAAGWGILYLMITVWSCFLFSADRVGLLQIINNGATTAMGIFTVWFERWYPGYIMSGKRKTKSTMRKANNEEKEF